jgi:hypothetical protein
MLEFLSPVSSRRSMSDLEASFAPALATFVVLVVLTSFGVFWWWLLG